MLRALGAGARRLTGVLLAAQAVAAAPGAAVGIPLGLLALRLAYAADKGPAKAARSPEAWELVALVPAAIALTALASLPTAVLANRVSPGIGLRASREQA